MSNGTGSSPEPSPHAQLVQCQGHWSTLVYVLRTRSRGRSRRTKTRCTRRAHRTYATALYRFIRRCDARLLSESDSRQFSLTTRSARRSRRMPLVRALSVLTIGRLWSVGWRADVLSADGKSVFEKALRRADLRLPGSQPEERPSSARNDDRLPWRRTAGGGGCL